MENGHESKVLRAEEKRGAVSSIQAITGTEAFQQSSLARRLRTGLDVLWIFGIE